MGTAVFDELDRELPVALLPVRLEARYLPRRDPTHLCIRIFPDVIHADAHRPALSTREVDAGRSFWRTIWRVADATMIGQARAWLAAQTSTPQRALWVATATTPENLDDADAPEPDFPQVDIDDTPRPVRAALLPDEWMVRLYDDTFTLVHTAFTGPVNPDLVMAPALSARSADQLHPKTGKALPPPLAFLSGQDLLWTVDFDLAVDAGMALRIPIADVPDPVGALLVLGARGGRDPLGESEAFAGLLDAHWYTRGLDAVPQGTPTNNTDAGRSGVSLSSPDIDALFEREASERPMAPLGRGVLLQADPALLYRLFAADTLSLAIGRLQRNPLDKVAHAEWGEGAAAWAMNLAIGYATIAFYLSQPFAKASGETVTSDLTATLRDWYADWVRGGALVPALRCGEQPYGLLPITHRPAQHWVPQDFVQRVEHHVDALRPVWAAALPVPALDPDATDGTPGSTPQGDTTVVSEVLGAVPHITGLRFREATNHLNADVAALYEIMEQLETKVIDDNVSYGHTNPGGESLIHATWFRNRKRAIFGLPDERPPVEPYNLTVQQVHVDLFTTELQRAIDDDEYVTLAPEILEILDGQLRPLLDVYRDAIGVVPEPLIMWATSGGLGNGDMINLTATTYGTHTDEVADLVTTDGDAAEIRDIVLRLIAALEVVRDDRVRPDDRLMFLEPFERERSPLLVHLLNITYFSVPVDDVGPVLIALRVLLALIDSELVDDPERELIRLLRESLGIVMYRLDAWITSLAAKRFADRRRARPAGLQIGGFGWLLDLAPSDDRPSQGFIHAPSLNHAATAAVVRAGWSAYGTAQGAAPLSVDLTSDRVRGAHWALDAVRNGQDLAELLGARFERYLHDHHLDDWIETVRSTALEAQGVDRLPDAVVNGLLLARSAAGVDLTDLERDFRGLLQARTAPTADPGETARRRNVRRAWQHLGSDLDAVADLTLTQAVHALIQGNDAAASAAMGVMDGGDGAVPPIDVAATQRDGQLVHHRVVAVFPATETPPAPPSALPAAEPRLIPWLDALLPHPGRVGTGYTATATDGTTTTGTIALADLGLGALDAALLADGSPSQANARLGRVVRAHLAALDPGAVVELDPSAGGAHPVSLDEFGLVAMALVHAVGRARPLRAGDLARPGDGPSTLPTADAGELEARIPDVEAGLAALIEKLAAGGAARREALLTCITLGVPASLTALEAGATDDAVTAVIVALKARLAPGADADGSKPGATPPDAADPVGAALQRLTDLIGGAVPVCPVFTPSADPDRSASARSQARQRDAANNGPPWLAQVARVRPQLAPVLDLLTLADAAGAGPRAAFGLAQVPHTAGPWAATGRPAGDRDHLSIFALTGARPLATKGAVSGLYFDGWTEGIPRSMIQTGLAVHFDAPTARAPQSILLSVVDDDRGFSADELCDQLLYTIELAKLRAVGPDRIPDIGHYIPAVFVPSGTTISDGPR